MEILPQLNEPIHEMNITAVVYLYTNKDYSLKSLLDSQPEIHCTVLH